ncbi:hypothetical protein BJF92_13825 [Rhizobium rhizosphaerae]|uniref:Biotin-protein ligase N-terminal domain-containing protein n=1 Tax=Xaviernesmea rhizosphaerae TaxID=1672749 RepID=A0A1Q9AIA6_9HYPH|nr:BPL-N domain-containing protein [Xaviernesmea rhizosphaerae]OLP54880.1 hypothetical protein BJF92_13825 [Xaviernesmea rhizosphaerae]
MTILIYQDNVSANGALYTALCRLFGKASVHLVNAHEVIGGALDGEVSLFVMPGGAARYKAAKLQGAGHARILDYVARGGAYLGICAGAYYACTSIEWARGTPYEIRTADTLALFNGRAIGPIDAFSPAGSYNGSAPRLITLDMNGKRSRTLYWGGCHFQAEPGSTAEIVARFADLPDAPAAIVAGGHGKGRWLLSSPHIEYDAQALDLIDFDVTANDYAEIRTLGDWSDLTLHTFETLLARYLL